MNDKKILENNNDIDKFNIILNKLNLIIKQKNNKIVPNFDFISP